MKHIILSRVDNIGDVVLTLPLAGILKELYPECKISFLAKNYTRPIIESCKNIDEIIIWEEILQLSKTARVSYFKSLNADSIVHVFPHKIIAQLAFLSKIKTRIGTARRPYNLLFCNKKVNISRRKSNLHEAQLNCKLLAPLGLKKEKDIKEISKYFGLTNTSVLPPQFSMLLSDEKFNLILHPKSKGSAREWGMNNFTRLIELLPKDQFKIFVTGSTDEGKMISGFLEKYCNQITDLTGRLTLAELIAFINAADGLVAASTGPLHIASALGKFALGIYAPMRPIFPTRWAPIGANSEYLVLDKECKSCKKSKDCLCIRSIKPEQVAEKVLLACQKKFDHAGRCEAI